MQPVGFRPAAPVNTRPLAPRSSLAHLQGVVTAATGAGVTMMLRRALAGTGLAPSGLGQVRQRQIKRAHLYCALAACCTSYPDHAQTAISLQAAGKESSVTAAAASTGATLAAPTVVAAAPPPTVPPPPPPDGKPVNDVVAGAMARAASQSTIHPLDTMKVRMQTGRGGGGGSKASSSGAVAVAPRSSSSSSSKASTLPPRQVQPLQRRLLEVKGLYKVGWVQGRSRQRQGRAAFECVSNVPAGAVCLPTAPRAAFCQHCLAPALCTAACATRLAAAHACGHSKNTLSFELACMLRRAVLCYAMLHHG